jgi:hypothetical protein
MNRTGLLLVLVVCVRSAEAQTWNPIVNMNTVGYSDSSSRTIVRTNNNVVYYCMNASAISNGPSALKIFKGNAPVPTSFTEMDAVHEPTDSTRIIGVDCRLNSSTGIISIIFQLSSPLTANYITYDTNADKFGTPEVIAPVNHAPTLRYLSKVSLALDSSGVPHVTYGGDNEGFSYNNRIGGTWNAALRITNNLDDMHPSLTFGTDGVLHLAWMNFDSPRWIMYKERSVAGVWSSTETVDGNVGTFGDKVDQSRSIALTIDNKPLILYHNQANINAVVVIKQRTAANTYVDVSPAAGVGAAGHDWSLAVPWDGDWIICGHDMTNPVQPSCVTHSNATGTWGTKVRVVNDSTARDGSTSMRYDVVWPGDQSHIDVAYHDENTPPASWFFGATIPGPGSGNSPTASFSTTSLNFSNQVIGTTSPSQSVTITSTGSAALSISAISVTAGYAENDNCGATLTPGTSCQINVTFTPTSTGPVSGTLTISNNGANSPQGVSLSGTGVDQFHSISGTISGSAATVTLSGGATATTTADSSGLYSFSGLANGTYTVTPNQPSQSFSPPNRAVTLSGANITGVNFVATINTVGEILFTSQTPALLNQSDGSSTNYELGVAFSAHIGGSITAIRFWKDARETGTHTGHLWTATGQLLATAVFSNETGSGWQQANLPAAVQIAANTQYVASVNTGSSYFVVTSGGLAAQITNQDLTTVVGNNGLYGSRGQFPTSSYRNSNYFRDLVFSPGSVSFFTASGNVSPAASGAGTTLTLSGAKSGTATADANGNYTLSSLTNGSYTVTPSKTGVTFTPSSLPFTLSGSSATGLNFSAAAQTGSISGTITPLTGGSGTTMTLTGPTNATVTANSSGNYSFSSLPYGTYSVTPSQTGFTFTPASQPVTVNGPMTGVNFTAVAQTGSISGTITPPTGGSGTTMTLTGPTNATVMANSSGNYSFSSLPYGTYSVTPSQTGFTFTPTSQSVTVNGLIIGVNFTAVAQTGSISGTISPVSGGGGAKVTLSGSANATTTANSSGAYTFSALANGTYTVTPSNSGYSFAPTSQTVGISSSNVANINFTASSVTSGGPGSIAIDAIISQDRGTPGTIVTTPVFATSSANELLLALISADVQTSSGTNNTVDGVTGGGLTWVLVSRANRQRGTSEIWRAFAPSVLANVSVSATLSLPGASSITVVSFRGINIAGTNGSGAIGATATGGASSGGPTASLTTTVNNSWVIGVGNDWDNAIPRTVGPNQILVHSYLAPIQDTYWVQRLTTLSLGGTRVTINDTAPTSDQYNLSICEILPGQ